MMQFVTDEATADAIRICRRSLRTLRSMIGSRLQDRIDLPDVLRWALDYAAVRSGDTMVSPEERDACRQAIEDLTPFTSLDMTELCHARSLQPVWQAVQARNRCLANWDKAGSIWLAIHSSLDQHALQAAAGLDGLDATLTAVTNALPRVPGMEGCAERLHGAWKSCENSLVSLETPQSLHDLVGELLTSLPDVPRRPPTPAAANIPVRRFRVIIVEDHPTARKRISDAVVELSERLGTGFTVEELFYSNVDDALEYFKGKPRQVGAIRQPDICDIAVIDMGLPRNAQEEQAVQEKRATPARTNGLELLRAIRSYALNIPCIVLTTPSECLEDPLQVCALGIKDAHYLLKGVDEHERLVEALWWIAAERSRTHTIDLQQSPSYEVSIDGVPIPLQDMHFRTFYALCELCHYGNGYYSTSQILDSLDGIFRSDFDYRRRPETAFERAQVLARQRSGTWWRSEWADQIANVMLCWDASKKLARDPVQALFVLRENYKQQLLEALRRLDNYRKANPEEGAWASQRNRRVDTIDPPLLAAAFDTLFGGANADTRKDYSLDNLEKHIGEVRTAIYEAFNRVHRYIDPRTEVVVDASARTEGGYRVLGDIRFTDLQWDENEDEDTALNRAIRPHTVLVVEDDRQCLGRLAEILHEAGFDVRTATNLQDALVEVQSLEPPDILSLDLQIPGRPGETADSADEANGLKVLEAMREYRATHDFQVVLPSIHYNRSDLGAWAARLEVPVYNIVPKGGTIDGAPWEGRFLMTVLRLRDQLRHHRVLPPSEGVPLPIVRIEPGSDLDKGQLKLTVDGKPVEPMRGNQGKFMACLLRSSMDSSGEEVVSFEDLDLAVYGGPATHQQRKQLQKYVRKKIAGWYPDADGRAELKILEAVDGGMVLHVHVEDIHND